MSSAADLPVEIVEEIFLRIDDATDLLRASAACASFRRVVSNAGFLRRFRSLHRRPVLGLLTGDFRFHPADPPRRSAKAARAVARATRFSSYFLPAGKTEHCWHVHDARDGRVLLSQSLVDNEAAATCLSLSYLMVYDPMTYNHVLIPPIPNDLETCTCNNEDFAFWWRCRCCCCCDCDCEFVPFLVPSTADEDELSFQVICIVMSADSNVLKTFIYSSINEKWCGLAPLRDVCCKPVHYLFSMKRHYAHGCFYWVDYSEKDMIKLDLNEMKFSIFHLPYGTDSEFKIVVGAAEEDRIGLLVLREDTLHLYTKLAFGGANDCCQWRHDAVITLLDYYHWGFGDAADHGYTLLLGIPRSESKQTTEKMVPITNAHYFTVELHTLTVEQLCVTEFDTEPVFLYASFPPPFAPPSL